MSGPDVSDKTGRDDPVTAVLGPRGGYWANARHGLEALRQIGTASIMALVVADREIAR
jgi:hypothetical protein